MDKDSIYLFSLNFQASTLSLKPQQENSVDLATEIENLVKLKMVRICCHGNPSSMIVVIYLLDSVG